MITTNFSVEALKLCIKSCFFLFSAAHISSSTTTTTTTPSSLLQANKPPKAGSVSPLPPPSQFAAAREEQQRQTASQQSVTISSFSKSASQFSSSNVTRGGVGGVRVLPALNQPVQLQEPRVESPQRAKRTSSDAASNQVLFNEVYQPMTTFPSNNTFCGDKKKWP